MVEKKPETKNEPPMSQEMEEYFFISGLELDRVLREEILVDTPIDGLTPARRTNIRHTLRRMFFLSALPFKDAMKLIRSTDSRLAEEVLAEDEQNS